MILQILSDLHIEFAPFKMAKTNADVIILAGDLHLGLRGFRWLRENFPNKKVIYVLGNHEFYNEAIPKLIEKLQERSKGTNVHILEKEGITIENVRFLGCTLWTDFELFNNFSVSTIIARSQMTDYKRIRISPTYRKIKPSFTVVWHNQSKLWLA